MLPQKASISDLQCKPQLQPVSQGGALESGWLLGNLYHASPPTYAIRSANSRCNESLYVSMFGHKWQQKAVMSCISQGALQRSPQQHLSVANAERQQEACLQLSMSLTPVGCLHHGMTWGCCQGPPPWGCSCTASECRQERRSYHNCKRCIAESFGGNLLHTKQATVINQVLVKCMHSNMITGSLTQLAFRIHVACLHWPLRSNGYID